jgi:aspartate/methionine/tyrosine aminotransferase
MSGSVHELLRLKPTRAARVSEISEATASSGTPAAERVNFHIGNPVEDPRLASAYLRAALGLDIRDSHLTIDSPSSLHQALNWDDGQLSCVEFFARLVQASAPYLPRGGFARTIPSPLAQRVADWFTMQQEPLTYDLGSTSGKREIIFASGGVAETLRVLFHALSQYLVRPPATVYLYRLELPEHLRSFAGLRVQDLPPNEGDALAAIRAGLVARPEEPVFLVLGSVPSEQARRSLRSMSVNAPLMILEANDAHNHQSLAREAKLGDSVVRLLTPAVFSPALHLFPLVIVAGNSEVLRLLETVHFQLKGTPSASEVELLEFILSGRAGSAHLDRHDSGVVTEPPSETVGFGGVSIPSLAAVSGSLESSLERSIGSADSAVHAALGALESLGERVGLAVSPPPGLARPDPFVGMNAAEALDDLVSHAGDPLEIRELELSFLGEFCKHHPEYIPASCFAVSGSARTALSLLGYHCGIREVVTPDLGWTYEHCFPSVTAVPLDQSLGLDPETMISTVRRRLQADPRWRDGGAVVINNPHNATGSVFQTEALRALLSWLLEHDVRVLDDLSYQNVAPSADLPSIPTVRQLADELVAAGRVTVEQAARVVTVHSLSKTDSLAGARLSVVEIREPGLHRRFAALHRSVAPNGGALLLTYLFYRNSPEVARAYWRLRNRVFLERMNALQEAMDNLPPDRNPYSIEIIPPRGSMYPLLVIRKLPSGLSLEWIASGLARQGLGLIPLSTFARTEDGFETGRSAFRLTLGGTDPAPVLLAKTRRVLIDLTRLIADEQAGYSRKRFVRNALRPVDSAGVRRWEEIEHTLRSTARALLVRQRGWEHSELTRDPATAERFERFLAERLSVFRHRFLDRAQIAHELVAAARADRGARLTSILQREFHKDLLGRRKASFSTRLFDRTVHPTQMHSIRTEAAVDQLIRSLLRKRSPAERSLRAASRELLEEFFGRNVALTSSEEAEEVLVDFDAHLSAELSAELHGANLPRTVLSFWGDWDGSTRPSGQGHRLIAAVLLENLSRLSNILRVLVRCDPGITIDPELLEEVERLPAGAKAFGNLLNEITALTHQLERRYRGLLPFQATAGRLRSIGMALHIARDPVTSLWRHNDRLERKMLDLRRKRREGLERYFALNKRVRKELHRLIPELIAHLGDDELALELTSYRDLLQRFILTPRIHQRMITAQDPFAIDTTVFNITEINELGARYGNPGAVLALQVSMSTDPAAITSLDLKMRARREAVLRDNVTLELPSIWLVPLFEGAEAVRSVIEYMSSLWDYALQSRRLDQETGERFAEMMTEVFIAGSDLSQQVGQAAGAHLYRKAKFEILRWLAAHGLAEKVRLKMGSGEPMQRQGGYYSPVSGERAFIRSAESETRFRRHLRASTHRSTTYAITPAMGVFAGGDLRTFQSALSEHLRQIPAEEFAQLRFHLATAQQRHRRDLIRAAEEVAESRLQSTTRSIRAMERLTLGVRNESYEQFLALATENFRRILYGREEDVVGIHMISYFIARTLPPLRDRPTVRPTHSGKDQGNRILERIAETIPFSRYGSLLRAIAHNQAQSAVLGVNQLTTGLFRALDVFAQDHAAEGDAESLLAERIVPHLPVYEILLSLRLYHDPGSHTLQHLSRAFPAGSSAFLALREDNDALHRYLPLLQQELLRRHGIDVSDFFTRSGFIPDLLPTLRPDLAVLLQPDLFNTQLEQLSSLIPGPIPADWVRAMEGLLQAPAEIRLWRAKAWTLLEEPVFGRVQSFVELAISLHSLSSRLGVSEAVPAREFRLPSGLAHFFRMSRPDDEMRQFLAAAVSYLGAASGGALEVPTTIVRAMRDVQRIAEIEEQPLSPPQQEQLRYYLLQIARLAGENG